MPGPTPQARYWAQTRRLTAALLLVWFVATFVVTYYARELRFSFLGWPFSFYMAAQGSLLIYLLIVYLYARWQRRRDAAFGVREDDED
jgi:putative solute:sodium symporter small subunit